MAISDENKGYLADGSLYNARFSREDNSYKAKLWKVLTERFFRRYVHKGDAVLDVASGTCEFINQITCAESAEEFPRRRIAIDCNESISQFAARGVEAVCGDACRLSQIEDESIDVVFVSNFFEHLQRDEILQCVTQIGRVIRRGGICLILQPNYRYAYREYFDFFDHITPVTDRSLDEIIRLAGGGSLVVEKMIPRFLPYTTKSRLPKSLLFVRLYLRLPFVWRFFGKQLFCVVRKVK